MFKKKYRYLISIGLFFLIFLPISSVSQELNEVGQLKITEVLEKSLEEFKIPGFVALITVALPLDAGYRLGIFGVYYRRNLLYTLLLRFFFEYNLLILYK